MEYKNYQVYDDDTFFEKYNQKRKKGDSPNELIEQPIIDELIGQVKGKKILDLGCGDGKYGAELLKKGAKQYHGIEGSYKMASLARENLKCDNSIVEENDIEKAKLKRLEYDLVLSRLVLHYIEDLEMLFKRIGLSLKDRGEFVFSVEHPIITSCYESYNKGIKRGDWIVDDYFDSGERINIWLGKKVVKYHKTLGEYWKIIKESSFEVIEIRESKPQQLNFKNIEEYQRRMRVPLFLIFKLKKI